MISQPAQSQTKLLLIIFSSVILLLLIGAIVYKAWYSNTFSSYDQAPPLSLELSQTNPIAIKLVPDRTQARVGESITYTIVSSETIELLGLSLKLLTDFEGGSLDIESSFDSLLEDGTALINQTATVNGVAEAELAIITTNLQEPVSLLEGMTIAQISVTPRTVGPGILRFTTDPDGSLVTLIIDDSRPIILDTEPVVITE